MNKSPEIQSAHGILLLSGSYLLQLRDNKPTIAAPGQWAFFGGMLQKGETPLQAVKREIFEELEVDSVGYKQVCFEDYYSVLEKSIIRSWFFEADVTAQWSLHKLNEGRVVKAFRFEEIDKLEIPTVMQKVIRFHYREHQKR